MSGLAGLRARWNIMRSRAAGSREIPYLDCRIIVNAWDLEQRGRKSVLDERDLPASVRLWRAATLRKPSLCVDVGANYGAFTLAGRYPTGVRCLSFEPNPDVWGCLNRSIKSHPDAPQITLHRLAASDEAGSVEFHVDTLKSGCSSLHASPRFRGATRTVKTDTVLLDEFISEKPGDDQLLLIKTDTEGNDYRVLRGARALLGGAGAVIGLSEFAPDLLASSNDSPTEFLAFLSGQFHLWWVHDKPAARLRKIERDAIGSAAEMTGNLLYATDPEAVAASAAAAGVPND